MYVNCRRYRQFKDSVYATGFNTRITLRYYVKCRK